ncbi:hypothetical protein Tco_1573008 [Tanacetum coccineum]
MEQKMYVKFSNNLEAEQRGSYLDVEGIKWVISQSWQGADDFVVYYDARSKDWKHAWKREKVIACTSRQLKVLMKNCMTNVMLYRGVERRSKANNEFEIDV